jgi:putative autotransporter adhesin-like protein
MVRLIACVVLLAGCNVLNAEPGNGKAARQTRTLVPFHEVELSGSLAGDITLGPTQSVEITGDENLLPLVETEVEGGTLKVHTTRSVRPKLEIAVHVVVPAIDAVSLSGSCTAKVQAQSDKLSVSLSGSGSITASGKVGELSIKGSGSTKVAAAELAADRVHISISGSGDAEVAAATALDVDISGSGSVVYHGHPKVTKSISGSGSVEGRP